MRDRTKRQLERIDDNFQRLLIDPKQKDKTMLVSGTLMKIMKIMIRQLDEILTALEKEGIL